MSLEPHVLLPNRLHRARADRHPVLTPAALVLGHYLSLCPCACARDAAMGVLTASLAMGLSAPAGRLVPEALSLLTAVVHALACAGAHANAPAPRPQQHP